MEPHRVYQEAMPRGAAVTVAREMGFADGSFPRRWRRPAAAPDNLFTGELSPMMKAKIELLAHDRTRPEAADFILFSFIADLARQRARRSFDNRERIVLALTDSYATAIKAFTLDQSADKREADLYRAGGAIVRALAFVYGDDGAVEGEAMRMADERPNFIARFIQRLRRRRPLLCCFGLHDWETSPEMRRCRRFLCGKVEAGIPRR